MINVQVIIQYELQSYLKSLRNVHNFYEDRGHNSSFIFILNA